MRVFCLHANCLVLVCYTVALPRGAGFGPLPGGGFLGATVQLLQPACCLLQHFKLDFLYRDSVEDNFSVWCSGLPFPVWLRLLLRSLWSLAGPRGALQRRPLWGGSAGTGPCHISILIGSFVLEDKLHPCGVAPHGWRALQRISVTWTC